MSLPQSLHTNTFKSKGIFAPTILATTLFTAKTFSHVARQYTTKILATSSFKMHTVISTPSLNT